MSTPSEVEVTRFVLEVCRRAGVRVVRTGNVMGMVDVPARYVAVIDALNIALLSVVRGEGLPELAPRPEPTAGRKPRR